MSVMRRLRLFFDRFAIILRPCLAIRDLIIVAELKTENVSSYPCRFLVSVVTK